MKDAQVFHDVVHKRQDELYSLADEGFTETMKVCELHSGLLEGPIEFPCMKERRCSALGQLVAEFSVIFLVSFICFTSLSASSAAMKMIQTGELNTSEVVLCS